MLLGEHTDMTRNATEILSRDALRENAQFARLAAEMVERHAMTATPGTLEAALRTLREATTSAIGAFRQVTAALEAEGPEADG